MTPQPARFTAAESDAAHEAWQFNCGPGALCGVLGLTPDQVRPHMGDFETKGYTNPSLMKAALVSLEVDFTWRTLRTSEVDTLALKEPAFPSFGLARVQFGGPWTKFGVPAAARYRHTHWVGAARMKQRPQPLGIFDINLVCDEGTGWAAFGDWARLLVPALTEQIPRADGTWWLTHVVEITRGLS